MAKICHLETKRIDDHGTTKIIPQTAFWGQVKRNQGFIPRGFGGHLYHRIGSWDYPYRRREYDLFKSQEINN